MRQVLSWRENPHAHAPARFELRGERPGAGFAGPEMGKDALRVLGEYLNLYERIAAEVQAGRPRLRNAMEWSKRVKSGK